MSNYEDVYAPDLTEETESTLSGSEQFVMFDSVEGKRAELSTIADYIVANGEIDGSDIPTIVSTIEGNIGTLDTKVGDLTDLDTTDKTDIVSAINEVNGKAEDAYEKADTVDEHVGDLSELETEDKTSAVDAINEVLGKIPVMTKEVTGNPIVVDDALNADVVSLDVELEPVQDLHGYDKPWAAGAGKNKLNLDTSVTVLVGDLPSAVTITSEEGKATITEGYYSRTANIFGWAFNVESNQSYTYSFTYSSTATGVAKIYTSDGTILDTFEVVNGNITRTFNSGANTTLYFYLSITSWDQTMTITNVQIEKGSTATTYSPYSNICPITGHDSVTVTDTGINQWDEEMELGYIDVDTGAYIDNTNNLRTKNKIPVFPSTSYYIALNKSVSGNIGVIYYDKNEQFISSEISPIKRAYTTPSGCRYMAFFVLVSWYGNTYTNDISVNLPSTDTAYHAYHGQSKTVTLPHTVYGGKPNITTGNGKEKYNIADLSTFEWSVASPYYVSTSLIDLAKKPSDNAQKANAYAEKYNVVYRNGTNNEGDIAIASDGRVYCRTSTSPTGQFCYETDTYSDLSTTPTDLTLYNGDNVVSSDGDMDMVYVRDIVKVIEKLEG